VPGIIIYTADMYIMTRTGHMSTVCITMGVHMFAFVCHICVCVYVDVYRDVCMFICVCVCVTLCVWVCGVYLYMYVHNVYLYIFACM